MPTFEKAEAVCFAEKREVWSSHGPAQRWRSVMDRYVLPKIGAMPVDRVGSAAVYEVLRPVALAGKHATVKMAGTAITAVLEWARIAEFRAEGSPVETVRRRLFTAAAHPGTDVDAHRVWRAQALPLLERAERMTSTEEEPSPSALLAKWPRLKARIAHQRTTLSRLHALQGSWVDWSELRSAVARGAALDREAFRADAPVTCASQYRDWYFNDATQSRRRVKSWLEDEPPRGVFERRPEWKTGMREDLAGLVRLRERHRLCALAATLSASVQSRNAPDTSSIDSGAPGTGLRGHALRSREARDVLQSPHSPLGRRLAELPGLEQQLRDDLATLDRYHEMDEEAKGERDAALERKREDTQAHDRPRRRH